MDRKLKRKDSGDGIVYSTDPDWNPAAEAEDQSLTIPAHKQLLRVRLDNRVRSGKKATLVEHFQGSDNDLAELARQLKMKCAVGGAVKDGVIVMQGDCRARVTSALHALGYLRTRQV
jgi:translation initiation factor 1